MQKSTSATAREREVFRYFQPLGVSPVSDNSFGQTRTRQSSSDPALTAFAQLGAHRLKARRGLITLSTKDTEYIVAESGVGLGLQQDDDSKDPLWHGTGALQKNIGLGTYLCQHFSSSKDDCLIVDNLTTREPFSSQFLVTDGPKLRFLACVPLKSPLQNMVIGTYIIVDDKPRNGLSEEDREFILEMGVTVMDHLEAQRNNRKQYRSERMVKAIGLFIEGKSTLREWWLEGGYKSQSQKATVRNRLKNDAVSLHRQADIEFGVQEPVEQNSHRGMESFSTQDHRPSLPESPSSSIVSNLHHTGDGRPKIPIRDSFSDTAPSTVFSNNSPPESVTTFETTQIPEDVRQNLVAFDESPKNVPTDLSKELREALLTKDLKAVFSRAGNLIREASGVDGSVFFDASVGSFGAASEADVMGQTAPGNFHNKETMAISDDDQTRISSDTDNADKQTAETSESESYCSILGFSTRKQSSLKGHNPPPEYETFPDRVMRTMLKRYPHGKVFNFEEDGSFSSSDNDNSCLGRRHQAGGCKPSSQSQTTNWRRRISREAETEALLKVLPAARSIFWFPLWDSSREKWYAGILLWTSSPTRTLCPDEDLTYLAAFGNSIMAEVARLSAEVITQMKTDFISSISHELRSPLHGVLASVEFLQETELSEVQADMVGNIYSSGRVLLDTINHVLDFSKVNRKMKQRSKLSRRKTEKKDGLSSDSFKPLDNTIDLAADLCVLTEQVVESVWVGRNYENSVIRQNSIKQSSAADSSVAVIIDISWRPSWTFELDIGAFRRILLNLFGNSIKYTKFGFIKVSVTVEQNIILRGMKASSVLILKVKDSGKGISKEFLQHHLFKPFTQEDSLAVGAGLGLSIVRHIVQDLRGEIYITSEEGVGTEATVKLPLKPVQLKHDEVSKLVTDVKAIAQGKTFALEGFDKYPDISETPTGILSAEFEAAMLLKSSVQTMFTTWFSMELTTGVGPDKPAIDVVVIMESSVQSLQFHSSPSQRPSIAIVLCNEYPPGTTSTTYGFFRVFYVPRPYGPHKIARTLYYAFTQILSPGNDSEANNKPPSVENFSQSPPVSEKSPASNDSVPKAQSCFRSPSLPQDPVAIPHKVHESKSIDTSIVRSTGSRVLLVEDNEINMKLLVAYMRKMKLNHATAINGLEALNTYKEANGCFSVIFMDISMPIMDGMESTRHIRRYERESALEPVAVIALTGAANPNTRQEAFSSGIDLFLTKPVPMKSLKAMLDDLEANGREGLNK